MKMLTVGLLTLLLATSVQGQEVEGAAWNEGKDHASVVPLTGRSIHLLPRARVSEFLGRYCALERTMHAGAVPTGNLTDLARYFLESGRKLQTSLDSLLSELAVASTTVSIDGRFSIEAGSEHQGEALDLVMAWVQLPQHTNTFMALTRVWDVPVPTARDTSGVNLNIDTKMSEPCQ